MTRDALRARCEARLRDPWLPAPFDVPMFCRALAIRRGRSILLQPIAGLAPLTGLWVAGTAADHIFYEADTSPLHRQHILLHELSHLWCEHPPAPIAEGDVARLLLPDFQPAAIRRILRRGPYTAADEQEAELLASLLLQRAANGPQALRRVVDPPATRLQLRLAESLMGDEDQER